MIGSTFAGQEVDLTIPVGFAQFTGALSQAAHVVHQDVDTAEGFLALLDLSHQPSEPIGAQSPPASISGGQNGARVRPNVVDISRHRVKLVADKSLK